MKKHTIAIFGGSGFVGHHLCAQLAKDGHNVYVITRHPERHLDLTVLPTVALRQANMHEQSSINDAVKDCDVVINLIGILNEAGHNGSGFYRAHVDIARKLLIACHQHNIKRLLHMSALNAHATKGSSHYLRSKGEAENLVHRDADSELKVTSFRPSVMFGVGENFLTRFATLLRWSPGVLLLPCAQSQYAPVYVNDVVSAFVKSLDDPNTYGQRYNFCGPQVYTLLELVTYVAELIKIDRKIIGLNNPLSKIMAGVLEYCPGKPFSKDNYLSTLSPSVCHPAFPVVFNILPTPLKSVVPYYLDPTYSTQYYLDSYRRGNE